MPLCSHLFLILLIRKLFCYSHSAHSRNTFNRTLNLSSSKTVNFKNFPKFTSLKDILKMKSRPVFYELLPVGSLFIQTALLQKKHSGRRSSQNTIFLNFAQFSVSLAKINYFLFFFYFVVFC